MTIYCSPCDSSCSTCTGPNCKINSFLFLLFVLFGSNKQIICFFFSNFQKLTACNAPAPMYCRKRAMQYQLGISAKLLAMRGIQQCNLQILTFQSICNASSATPIALHVQQVISRLQVICLQIQPRVIVQLIIF